MDNYKYIPDSYNYELLNSANISLDSALTLQIKYRNDFEKLLLNIIDFKSVDDYIKSYNFQIPAIEDLDYNFYHKFSILGSAFVFLRNNIHIENLSEKELEVIRDAIANDTDLSFSFLNDTFRKVLFENAKNVMFGIPLKENIVSGNSIVFEFAYKQRSFTSVKQYDFVKKIVPVIHKSIENSIKKILNVDVSFIQYNGITNIYLNNNAEEKLKLL